MNDEKFNGENLNDGENGTHGKSDLNGENEYGAEENRVENIAQKETQRDPLPVSLQIPQIPKYRKETPCTKRTHCTNRIYTFLKENDFSRMSLAQAREMVCWSYARQRGWTV